MLCVSSKSLESKVRICATLIAGLIVALISGCGDSGTSPSENQIGFIAGGGRSGSTDEFAGGPGSSGPNDSLLNPSYPDFPEQHHPLFLYCVTCEALPDHQIIDNETDWEAILNEIVDCLSDESEYDKAIKDSIVNYHMVVEIDFASNIVALITIESDFCWGNYLDITDISTEGNGTEISYMVLSPGDDCGPIVSPVSGSEVAEIVAVFEIPRPIEQPVSWIRSDSTYNCTWQPDPNKPLLLYYTDADCNLGLNEQIISDISDWEAWLETAFECDYERWGGWADTTYADCTYISPVPPEFTIPVDFSTHAVIVLRSDPQTRWGGGVWLNDLRVSDNGTEIDYSVMVPAETCPEIDESLGTLRPTAAIRVPLPLTEPIDWNVQIEEITCDWPDTSVAGTQPDSVNRKSNFGGN